MFSKIIDRKIRIAVVGCGRISAKHFEAIKQHNSELELVAVCDVLPVTLEAISKEQDVPGYQKLEDMLAKESLDVIALCSPSGLHSSQTEAAARAGVHVISEKPMATRWSDGVRMVKACDEAGVRLFIVKQNRRNTTLQLLKRAINEKRFLGTSTRVL